MVSSTGHAQTVIEPRLLPLNQPQAFVASLRAPSVHADEFRLHVRDAEESDITPDVLHVCGPSGRICILGFVLPKRVCKHAVRRNLIRRVTRECLREHLKNAVDWPSTPPVLVLKLTRKLPDTFISAGSPALARHVRSSIRALLQHYTRRYVASGGTQQPGSATLGAPFGKPGVRL